MEDKREKHVPEFYLSDPIITSFKGTGLTWSRSLRAQKKAMVSVVVAVVVGEAEMDEFGMLDD